MVLTEIILLKTCKERLKFLLFYFLDRVVLTVFVAVAAGLVVYGFQYESEAQAANERHQLDRQENLVGKSERVDSLETYAKELRNQHLAIQEACITLVNHSSDVLYGFR